MFVFTKEDLAQVNMNVTITEKDAVDMAESGVDEVVINALKKINGTTRGDMTIISLALGMSLVMDELLGDEYEKEDIEDIHKQIQELYNGLSSPYAALVKFGGSGESSTKAVNRCYNHTLKNSKPVFFPTTNNIKKVYAMAEAGNAFMVNTVKVLKATSEDILDFLEGKRIGSLVRLTSESEPLEYSKKEMEEASKVLSMNG